MPKPLDRRKADSFIGLIIGFHIVGFAALLGIFVGWSTIARIIMALFLGFPLITFIAIGIFCVLLRISGVIKPHSFIYNVTGTINVFLAVFFILLLISLQEFGSWNAPIYAGILGIAMVGDVYTSDIGLPTKMKQQSPTKNFPSKY
jgi:hypothetical protein